MSRTLRFKKLTCTDAIRTDLRSRSIRAVGLTGAAGFADVALRVASTAVLARMLLPEHFGVVMMVTAVTSVADQFRDLGLSTATVQKEEITHEEVSNLFWINTSAGLILTLIMCALSPLVAAYYRDPRLTLITCVLASNFILSGIVVQHQALLARTLRLGTSASVRLSSSILSTMLAVFLAWNGFGYWALVWREVARAGLLAGGMWLAMPWVPGPPYRQTSIKGMLRFGADLSAANIITNIGAGMDRLLLGRLWGASTVGIYRQAFQLLVVPLDQLLSPAYQVTQPGLSLLQDEPQRYVNFYCKLLTIVCAITMPLSLFVAIYSSEIVVLVLGSKWIECAPVLTILSLGGFIRQAAQSSAIIPITRGNSTNYLKMILLSNVVLVLLMAVGVQWGIRGLAFANTAADWLLLWPRLHLSFKGSPVTIRRFFEAIARPVCASIGMALVLMSLRLWTPNTSSVVALGIGSLAAAVSFPAVWLLLPGGKSEVLSGLVDIHSALLTTRVKTTPPVRAAASP